ncbi:MAG: tRNA (adenosine(37)-N6)-threonylcarbamoyltransferase complex dimerization subunit type 1 TsaB, partial [Bacteroidetes bacterium]|nr:tRNA (adenosine(37)-N6)-threonylcarbamoyltransferase complex dimerization subunit type 1 TsaB [Bacteroidota bacterium]
MTLLALETATDVCSVALMQGDRVTVALALTRPRAHAENLTPMIREALRYG